MKHEDSDQLVDLFQQQLFRVRKQRIMGNIQRDDSVRVNTLIHFVLHENTSSDPETANHHTWLQGALFISNCYTVLVYLPGGASSNLMTDSPHWDKLSCFSLKTQTHEIKLMLLIHVCDLCFKLNLLHRSKVGSKHEAHIKHFSAGQSSSSLILRTF